ncbi:MAG: DUF559 domain-containing protein [Flavitalea sp.]
MREDAERDKFLRDRGFRILRFENDKVLTCFQNVLADIREAIENNGG